MRSGQAAPSTEIAAIIDAHVGIDGPLLPLLHALQRTFGHVPQRAVPMIAEALNRTRAEVHGVVSFYHDFREAPAGRHVLRLCRAEACKAMGADQVAAATLDRLGVDWHGTTANGAVTVEPVYCLGLCACGPAAMLDETLIGRAGPERLGAALAEVGA